MDAEGYLSLKKGSNEIRLGMISINSNEIIDIQIVNIPSMKFHQLQINENYIHKQGELFAICVESVVKLYCLMTEKPESWSINEDGNILIEAELTTMNMNTTRKSFLLQTQKYEVSEIQLLSIQLQQFKNDVKTDLANKNQQISILQQQNIEMQRERSYLISQIRDLKTENEAIKEGVRREIESMRNYILENKRKDVQIYPEIMPAVIQAVEMHQHMLNNILDVIRQQKEESRRLMLIQLQSHPNNPHRNSFHVDELAQSISITKKENNLIWESFIASTPLGNTGTMRFKMRLMYTQNSNVQLGIGTQTAFGVQKAFLNPETLSFYAKTGGVIQKGFVGAGGTKVANGKTITIEVNMDTARVVWYVERKLEFQTMIPQQMRCRQLFLYVQMYHIGDIVEILLEH